LDLTSYDALFSGENASGVPAVVKYNADASLLYQKITDPQTGEKMPLEPGPPLTDEDIQMIEQWINEGASNN